MTDTAPTVVDKNVINGSKVIKREMAQLFSPGSKNPNGLSATYGVDRCELEDGSVIFQCVKPEAPECEYVHENGISVRSHLRIHSERTRSKVEAIKAERDALLEREQQRRINYSNGAVKAAATKRKLREERVMNAIKDAHEQKNGETDPGAMTPAEFQKKLDRALTTLDGTKDGIDKVRIVLANITHSVEKIVEDLEDLEITPVTVDPVLKAKADSWDAMQALLNPGQTR